MRSVLVLVPLVAVSMAAAASGTGTGPAVLVVEVVADPQTDWNGDGTLTPSDEFVELHNTGDTAVDLGGWSLLLEDTTPEEAALTGSMDAGARLVLWNPPGALNNDAVVRLVDAAGVERDRVAYGSYDETGTVPDANAVDERDEALAFDGAAWGRSHATPGLDADEAYATAEHGYDERDGAWYAPPNASRDVVVHLVHGRRTIDGLTLDGGPPATVTGAPGHVVDAVFKVDAGGPGSRDLVLGFELDGAPRSGVVGRLVVDGDPPTTPVVAAPAWAAGDAFVVSWEPSEDAGAGVAGYEVEVEREANGSRTVERVEVVEPTAVVGPLADGQVVDVRVRASDAYGNTGGWSVTTRTRVDNAPPERPRDLSVQGVSGTRVMWSEAADAGAGVDRYEVERNWDGVVDRFEVVGAAAWTDQDGPDGGNLSYRVRAVDAAGNAGEWNGTTADHPALHPAVVGVRVAKPVWASGVQEVRIDFDRRMDVSRSPQVAGGVAWSEARWFANESTFFLKASGPKAAQEGANAVRVVTAWAPDGRALREGAVRAFRVDTIAPMTRFDEAAFLFRVEDAQDESPRLFVKRWPSGETAPAAYVRWDVERNATDGLEPGRWRLRFFALDDAGNREVVQEATIVVPAPVPDKPPSPSSPTASASGGPTPLAVPATPTVASSTVPPPPTTAGETGGLAEVEAHRREFAAPSAGGSSWAWWGLALGGVTASGGVFAWRRDWPGLLARRWRAWRRPASLAVRLRRVRSKG